jgi:hypothetical protein
MFYYHALFVALVSLAALATPATKEGIPGPAPALNNATSTLEFGHFAGLQSDSCPTSCGAGSNEYLLSITFG